ncbi:hypothetical protein ASO20_01940 [Mycoplasma sp. (ex Biomphalaria glabrata)]|uniref:type I methionyl aminopeptidase n=1 Tax=Mycoplasma sp. (ex Biomphalaria glabrata) TaxID=1749074 RepID=UPI00073AA0A8|nr:type I methionyl aminopeptidase [Mycoplasma sp. (ex Biomphalaria glabrata)]ALV23406.1 hypothetical protein ASO20_01940 [Mycoplasma sp. (ex Biomphalaria glabrata)]
MKVSVKTPLEIQKIREVGLILRNLKNHLRQIIKSSMTLNQINDIAHDYITQQQGIPSFLNYSGFPKSICTSVNEVLIHGVPSEYSLKPGDLLSLDIGVYKNGYHVDSAFSMIIDNIDNKKAQDLIKCAEESFFNSIKNIKDGAHLSDIGKIIEETITSWNFFGTSLYCGHGIGKNLHEAPMILNYYEPSYDLILKTGMVLAIEPMVLDGSPETIVDKNDNWSVISKNHQLTAHYEHTIVITKTGYEILT